MSISDNFEKLTKDIMRSSEERTQRIKELKKDTHDSLKQFRENFEKLAIEVQERREKVRDMLQQFRNEFQEMHKIWTERKLH